MAPVETVGRWFSAAGAIVLVDPAVKERELTFEVASATGLADVRWVQARRVRKFGQTVLHGNRGRPASSLSLSAAR
jgi:hypothetical protein